ncbi:hypothetical protein [Streptomyces sp. NPDC054784]
MAGTGRGGSGADEPARWNEAAQRWETGTTPQAYVPPPPPRPLAEPSAGGAGAGRQGPEQPPGPGQTYAGQTVVGQTYDDGRTAALPTIPGYVPPPGGPLPGPGGGPGPGQGGFWLNRPLAVGLAVVAAAAAVGVAAWIGLGGDGDGSPSQADGTSTTAPAPGPDGGDPTEGTDPPQDMPSPSAPDGTEGIGGTDDGTNGTPAPADPPPGFRLAEDTEGFTLAVPTGWERTTGDTGVVFYTAPDDQSLLQVFRITEVGMTPLEATREASSNLSHQAAGYSELSVGPAGGGPENPRGDAAELHYSYDSADGGGRRECVERVFTAIDAERYALLACAPADEPAVRTKVLTTATQHFVPGSP